MMELREKINKIQKTLTEQKLDGWLLFDFRRSNDLACAFLHIPEEVILTRRLFYWIPRIGEPVKIVHAIEEESLESLPGKKILYRSWQELESCIEKILKEQQKIAMEYSSRNAIPYVSKVDGGTLELIRDFGVEVVSSADLIQKFTSVWDAEQYQTHLFATDVLCKTIEKVWNWISEQLIHKKSITEYDVQQFIVGEFEKHNCITDHSPICAVNENSVNPHYAPTKDHTKKIKPGDYILIDLWCKQNIPRAVFGDITRVAVAASKPTDRQQEIFDIVKKARNTATNLIKDHFAKNQPVMGFEVDQACRQVIIDAGYGEFFVHKTGHNIGEKVHGSGAHIDNFETQDRRQLIPGTCFSIEPGIYLPREFGVRLEYDVYIHHDGKVEVTGGIQESIECLGV